MDRIPITFDNEHLRQLVTKYGFLMNNDKVYGYAFGANKDGYIITVHIAEDSDDLRSEITNSITDKDLQIEIIYLSEPFKGYAAA